MEMINNDMATSVLKWKWVFLVAELAMLTIVVAVDCNINCVMTHNRLCMNVRATYKENYL